MTFHEFIRLKLLGIQILSGQYFQSLDQNVFLDNFSHYLHQFQGLNEVLWEIFWLLYSQIVTFCYPYGIVQVIIYTPLKHLDTGKDH